MQTGMKLPNIGHPFTDQRSRFNLSEGYLFYSKPFIVRLTASTPSTIPRQGAQRRRPEAMVIPHRSTATRRDKALTNHPERGTQPYTYGELKEGDITSVGVLVKPAHGVRRPRGGPQARRAIAHMLW
jgi:hypothetical protein